jgi:aspartyl-tRNA(Asn)/glutamyl-tRNA(Gln) amidotransferase subunit C
MAPTLSRDEVRRVAALARLDVTEAEVERLATELGTILGYAAEIQRIDTTGVVPRSQAADGADAGRDDRPDPSLDRDVTIGGAPDASTVAGLFRVPKVQ